MAATGSSISSWKRTSPYTPRQRAVVAPPGQRVEGVTEHRPDERRQHVEVDRVGAQPLDHRRGADGRRHRAGRVAVGARSPTRRGRRASRSSSRNSQPGVFSSQRRGGRPCCTDCSTARWNARSAAMSGAQSPGSARTIAQWLPANDGDADRDALDRQVGAQLVDGGELGLHVGPQLLLGLGHGVRAAASTAAGGAGCSTSVAIGRAQARVEAEQLEQDRRARAGRAGDDDRGLDHLVGDRRVAPALRRRAGSGCAARA